MLREIGKSYRLRELIGQGGYGMVFRSVANDDTVVAIKRERVRESVRRPALRHEARVLRLLSGSLYIPRIYGYGNKGKWNYLVMDLLGKSLIDQRQSSGPFSLKTTLMLLDQMLKALQFVHSSHILHQDIKPDNFLLGLTSSSHLVHLIDFGGARRYRDPISLQHVQEKAGEGFRGTARYASLNAHLGTTLSRRDDLESLFYAVMALMKDALPWDKLFGGTHQHRLARIREKKISWSPHRLCEGLPEELAGFLRYTRSLRFDEDPDYEAVRIPFLRLSERLGFVMDYRYDWCEHRSTPGATKMALLGGIPPPPDPLPVMKGQYIFIKLLARPTIEGRTDCDRDPSFWHDPSLSGPEWDFPRRPAVVFHINAFEKHCELVILPLMRRKDGLSSVAGYRKQGFEPIAQGAHLTDEGTSGIKPVPAWPLDSTYHYAAPRGIMVSIPNDHHVKAHWRLDDEQLSKLPNNEKDPVIVPQKGHASDGPATASVARYADRGRSFFFPIFAEATVMNPESLEQGLDVDWTGSTGWFREQMLIEKRRANWTWSSYDEQIRHESITPSELSYSGPRPSDRSLHCTLGEDDASLDEEIPLVTEVTGPS